MGGIDSLQTKLYDTLTKSFNYPRRGCPSIHGDYTYFSHNTGLQNQSVLYRVKTGDNKNAVEAEGMYSI